MAFVNEYVSEEDIQKYGLDDLFANYDPFGLKDGGHPGFNHAWTIDRDSNIYFMPVHTVTEIGRSGRDEAMGTTIFVLNINGVAYEAHLAKAPESSRSLSTNPFRIIWDLKKPLDDFCSLSVLKEALNVYGYWGIKKQIPNTIVEFNF